MDQSLINWINQIQDQLPRFINTLKVNDQPGRYRLCLAGETSLGKRAALGFSCFALKSLVMLNQWESIDLDERAEWVSFVQRFQTDDKDKYPNAFIDPVVIYDAGSLLKNPTQLLYRGYAYARNPRRILFDLVYRESLTLQEKNVLAETKQAIASLAEVEVETNSIYQNFPTGREEITHFLDNLDWQRPWGAGSRSAILAVFLATQAPRFLDQTAFQTSVSDFEAYIATLANAETGAYFRGPAPNHHQLVNGAMKVLTGLDWLDIPIHYPEKLIDTCLAELPKSDGCHLVDAVYVLYRSLQQTDHRRDEIKGYLTQVLEMVKPHFNLDGGFSYYVGRSQTAYYGVRAATGQPVSDLHGTILLLWATVMILQILEENRHGWNVIKP